QRGSIKLSSISGSMGKCGMSLLLAIGAIAGTGENSRQPAWSAEASPPAPTSPRDQPSTFNLQPSNLGVPAYAPTASNAEAEVIEAARWLGIPVVRTPLFPSASPVAFFCACALSDRQFPHRLRAFVSGGGRA